MPNVITETRLVKLTFQLKLFNVEIKVDLVKVAYSRIVLTNFQLDPPCGVRQYCRRHPPPLAVGVALDFACFAICER